MLCTPFSPIQPVTTTSPLPPHLGTARFPLILSRHQISQGYHPSLSSMFYRQSHSTRHGFDPVAQNLKRVSFPRNCMTWFTSIASINTAKNRETRGLLLGKDKGGRYVVTTLLIPKQYATSDTCAIEEEELVTQFTEERSLITLGWVCHHLSLVYQGPVLICSLLSDSQSSNAVLCVFR